MRFNPLTRRVSMTKAELAAVIAEAAAQPLEAMSREFKENWPRTAELQVVDFTRALDESARLIRRDAPTDVEKNLDLGRYRR